MNEPRHERRAMLKHLWQIGVAVLLLAWTIGAAWGGVPPRWKEGGYAYNAQGAALVKVLSDFARSHGVELRADIALVDPVPGMLKTATAAEFLDRLAARHRFQWFVHNQVLYVSPVSDTATERIEVPRDAIAEAKAALTGVGLFEAKFGWGEMPEHGAVTVSGPREYLRLVREVIAVRDRSDEYEPMLFRLKNAAVDDRTITVRNQTMVTPGAASLLKSMLTAGGGSPGRIPLAGSGGLASELTSRPLSDMLAGAAQSSSQGTTTGVAKRDSTPRTTGGPGRGVSVEGDVRTNSIVIYDLVTRRGYYQRLIDAIDVPQQLVEIEACVVDVNRDQVAELGFGFDARHANGRAVVDPAAVLAAPVTGGSTLIISGLDRFFARLNLMERDGQARVVAKPSVLTLENLVAVLDLSQTVYVRATGERVASIEAVTAGMLLRVTPRVVKEKQSTQVHLTVDIEDGKVMPGQPGTGTPEVQRSTISTQAVLLDQQSLIIGGYDTSTSSNADDAVPGISRIPLIGALFSGTKKVQQTRQRLFILTPRLVKPQATTRTS